MKGSFRASRERAFTRRDLIVIVGVVIALLTFLLVPVWYQARWKNRSVCCNCNLKQIGLSFRLWAGENGEYYPM